MSLRGSGRMTNPVPGLLETFVMRRLALLWVLLAAPAPLFAAEGGGQVVLGKTFKDFQYGFSLVKPSDAWMFMKEKEVGKLNADAVAGLFSPKNKAYAVVIPERFPGVEAEAYADLLISNMSIDDKTVVYRKGVVYGDLEGYQYKVRGTFNGIPFLFLVTLFHRDDFYFQLVTWWSTAHPGVREAEIETIHASFSFLEGVKPVAKSAARRETMEGLGWRVRGDVYENAVYGFRYALPGKAWRYMGPSELRGVNADACMGLQNAAAGLYTVVVAENIGDMGFEAYEKLIFEIFEGNNRFDGKETLTVGGPEGEMGARHYGGVAFGRMKMDFLIAVTVAKGVGCQIMSWCQHGQWETAAEDARKIPGGFSWLDGETREKVLETLRTRADELRSVGRGECYRNRTYRNFSFGLRISLPPGFWSHALGTQAREQNGDASLLFTNLEHDLNGVVILEQAPQITAEQYHGLLLSRLAPPEGTKTETLDPGGLDVRSTRFTSTQAGHDFIYHVVSASASGKHLQLLLHGLAKNLEKTLAMETAVVNSIRFSGTPAPPFEFLEDGSYVNHLMGFRVDAPNERWVVLDVTPASTQGLGAVVQLARPGVNRMATGGGVYADVEAEDLIRNFLENSEKFKDLDFKPTSELPVPWLGRPARQYFYTAGKEGSKLDIVLRMTSVGGIHYFVVVVEEKGEAEGPALYDTFRLVP